MNKDDSIKAEIEKRGNKWVVWLKGFSKSDTKTIGQTICCDPHKQAKIIFEKINKPYSKQETGE